MQPFTTLTQKHFEHRLMDNGLPVYVLRKPGFNKKYAVFATRYGSLDSEFAVAGKGVIKVPDGIAHFLEHKLFEEEDEHVFERFAKYGASVNAFTSYNMTAYLFSTIDHFPEALTELMHFVQNPYLTEANVTKERGIIEQELRMYDDNPDRRIYRNLLQALYHHHPIRLDVGGTVESIQEITVDLLMECYRLFYQPRNMVLFVVGDVDAAQVFDLVEHQNKLWRYQEQEIQRIEPDEPETVAQERIEDQLSISRPRYYLGFKDRPRGEGKELLKQYFIMNMIWSSIAAKSSPIFEKLYNVGLIDDSFGASFQSSPRYAFSVVGGETDNPNKLDAALREEISKLQQTKIQSIDIERMKRRTLGNYYAAFNSLDYLANSFIGHLFNGTNFFDIPEVVQSITVADVNQYLTDGLQFSYSAVSILMPEE